MSQHRFATRNFLRGGVLLFGVVAFACSNAFSWVVQTPTAFAASGINRQIPFQGRVVNLNGTTVVSGSYSFTFSLYTVATGGAPIWTETKNLTVTNSIFGTNLGSSNPITSAVDFNQDGVYLGINFNGDGEMTPRIQIGAVAQAINAEKVSGLTVTNTTGTLTIPNSATISFGASFTTSADPLSLVTTGATSVTLPTTGVLSTLAGTETLTNKTLGVTSFTGNLTPSGTIDLGATGNRFANLYVATADATNLTVSGNSSLGTVTGGTWQGSVIAAQYGGTGLNTSGSTGIPVLAGGTWSVLANGSNTQCLVITAGVPTWGSCAASGTVTGTGVAGQLSYWDTNSTIANASGLNWNSGASELGIGTASTIAPLTVRKASSGVVLAVRNTADNATVLSINSTGDISGNSLTVANGLTVSGGTVSLPAGEIGNTELANSSLTVTAGTNLTGGGSVSLGGSTSISVVGNPSFATSVTAPTINATTALQLGGLDVNANGTLSNVAYLAQANAFTQPLSVTSNAGNQISNRYNASNRLDISTTSTGATSLTAVGSAPAITLDASATGGEISMSTPGGNFSILSDGTITIGSFGTQELQLDVSEVSFVDGADIVGDITNAISGFDWHGRTIGETYGGTGLSSYTTGDIIYASGTNTLSKRSIGSNGDCFIVSAGIPTWGSCAQASNTLQAVYGNGNTITTTDAKDFAVTLANTTTDSNFIVNIATGSTGKFAVQNNGTDVFSVTSGSTTISSGGLTVTAGTVSLPAGEIGNTELANSSLTVTAGTGLSGGGAVSLGSSTTLSLPNVGSAATYGSASQVPVFTTDAQGRVTGVVATNIALAASAITTGQLAPARGGTGFDSSSSTGLSYISGGAWSALANGSNNQCLVVSGGVPTWGSCSAGGGVTGSGSAGSITYWDTNTTVAAASGLNFASGALAIGTATTTNGTFTVTRGTSGIAMAVRNTTDSATTFSVSDTGAIIGTSLGLGSGTITSGAINGQTISASANFTGSLTVANGLTVTAGTVSLPNGSIDNAELANSSLTVTAGTNLSGGGSVALGSSTTLNVVDNPTFSGLVTASNTNATALAVTGVPAASATQSLLRIGGAIAGGDTDGTYLGVNATSGFLGDLVNLQVNGDSRLSVGNSGSLSILTSGSSSFVMDDNGLTVAVGSIVKTAYYTGSGIDLSDNTFDTEFSINGIPLRATAGLISNGGLTVTTGTVSLPNGSIDNAELANSSLTVTAGTGLSGGGSVALGGSVSLSLPNVGSVGTYGSATQVPVFTTDAQGRITGVTNTTIAGVDSGTLDGLDSTDFLRATASDTYEGSYNRTLTVQSDLSGGNRSAALLSITQANDGTNNASAPLLQIVNNDTASVTAAVSIQSFSSGAGLIVSDGLDNATSLKGDTLTVSNDLAINSAAFNPTSLTSSLNTGSTFSINVNGSGTTTLQLANTTGGQVANLNLSDGSLQTNGTTRLTNGGVLQNVTYNGSLITADYGGTGQASYAVGDLLYASGTTTLSKLTAGANGQCLVLASGVPSWSSCATAAVTLQAAYDNGNTIALTNARNLGFTLSNTATDPNFLINIASGSTGKFAVQDNGTDILSVASGDIFSSVNITATGFQVQTGGSCSSFSATTLLFDPSCGGGSGISGDGTDVTVSPNSSGRFYVTGSGSLGLVGVSSGTVSISTQAAAGTYNFNLPTTAGSSGYFLTSAGGGATAMTWTDPTTLSVSTATNLAGGAAGNIPYQTGAGATAFVGGSAGQILSSNGSSAPSFINLASTITQGTNISITGTTNPTIAVVSNPTFSGLVTASAAGTALTVTNDATVGGTLSLTALTQGSIPFIGASGVISQANSMLFYDSTNTSIGFGATRSGALSSTNAFVQIQGVGANNRILDVKNNGGTSLLTVTSLGNVISTLGPTSLNAGGISAANSAVTLGGRTVIYNTGVSYSDATLAQLQLTSTNLVGGDADGTFLGLNALTGYAGDLINFQLNGAQRLTVTAAGAVTTAGGLTVASGGASITGGIDNNSGGITEAGAVSGVTTLSVSTSVTSPIVNVGTAGASTGLLNLSGSTSGTVTIQTQAAAGTYNFNLPTTAGTSGYILTSGGGAGTAMTWTNPSSLGVSWSSLTAPTGNLSLNMGTNTTAFDYATGTGSSNLFNLTTANSSNGTGYLLNVATGTGSTVKPLRVAVEGTDVLTVGSNKTVSVNGVVITDDSDLTIDSPGAGLLDVSTGFDTLTITAGAVINLASSVSAQNGLSVSGNEISSVAGLTVTGGTVNLNSSSNFATNINTGTSTGAVTIGGGSGTFAVDSTALDISTAGAISGVTGITTSGAYVQSGTGANTFTGVTTLSAVGTALSVTNNASIGGTLGVGGAAGTNQLTVVKDSSYNSEGTNGIRILSSASSADTSLQIGTDTTNHIGYIQAMQPGVDWSSRPLVLQGNGGVVNIGNITNTTALLSVGSTSQFQVASSGAITGATSLTLGAAAGTSGTVALNGSTSGTITIQTQAAAGTYNFNLPTTAGTSGYVLTSGGGAGAPMTWTDPAALSVRWNSITNPTGNQSLSMGTNTTTWNYATGTSTNNLFNLTTDTSANGTGALLNVQTGTSSTVLPARIRAGAVEGLMVDASGNVGIGTIAPGAKLSISTNGTSLLSLTHDATNGIISTTTGAINLQPASGTLAINKSGVQNRLRVYGSGGSVYGELTNDNTNTILTTSSGELQLQGTGTNQFILGSVGTAMNLVFEESSTISGQGTNTITVGQSGDTFNLNASGVTYNVGTLTSTGATLNTSATGTVAFTINGPSGLTANLLNLAVNSSNRLTVTTAGALSTVSSLTSTLTGANALAITGAPQASTTTSLVQLGSAIAGGSASGTFLGLNAAGGFAGNFVDLQVNGTNYFKVTASGATSSAATSAVFAANSATESAFQATGTPTGNAAKSLLQLGSAIAAGSTGGNYIGINSGAGFTGNFLELEKNGTQVLSVTADAQFNLTGSAITTSSWTQGNTNGFGSASNTAITGAITHNDALYYATTNTSSGTQVYRSTNGTSWTQVNTSGFGSANNTSAVLGSYAGTIYAATTNTTTGVQVWSSVDGSSWTQVNASGFSSASRTTATAITAFGGAVYVSTANGETFRSFNGTTWTLAADLGGSNGTGVRSFFTAQGYLYAASASSSGGGYLQRTQNGTTWSTVGAAGLGNAANIELSSALYANGAYFIATKNLIAGTMLYRSYDLSTFTQVNTSGFGSAANTTVQSMVAYNGGMYAVTGNTSTGSQVYYSADGSSYSQVNSSGFGSSSSSTSYSAVAFKGNLIVSVGNTSVGAQIWYAQTGTIKSTTAGLAVKSAQIGDVLIENATIKGVSELTAGTISAQTIGVKSLQVADGIAVNSSPTFVGNLAEYKANDTTVLSTAVSGATRLSPWNFTSVLQTTTAEAAFNDITSSANSTAAYNIYANSAALNDRTYFGFSDSSFTAITYTETSGSGGATSFEVCTALTGSVCTTWTAISGGSDSTTGLTTSGAVSWTNTLTKGTVNGISAYWVRLTVTSGMSVQANGRVILRSFENASATNSGVAFLLQANTTTSATSWSSGGTYVGILAETTFGGNFLDLRTSASSLFKISGSGGVSIAPNSVATTPITVTKIASQTADTIVVGTVFVVDTTGKIASAESLPGVPLVGVDPNSGATRGDLTTSSGPLRPYAGAGLTLNITAGAAYTADRNTGPPRSTVRRCVIPSDTTISMTASTTEYVYLTASTTDTTTGKECTVGKSSTLPAFDAQYPVLVLAKVVSGASITSVADTRFFIGSTLVYAVSTSSVEPGSIVVQNTSVDNQVDDTNSAAATGVAGITAIGNTASGIFILNKSGTAWAQAVSGAARGVCAGTSTTTGSVNNITAAVTACAGRVMTNAASATPAVLVQISPN